MVNYELAKELQESKFPINNIDLKKAYKSDGTLMTLGDSGTYKGELVWIPSFSELIEACGNEVGIYKISPIECNAWSKKLDLPVDDESNDFRYLIGSTPEEAVARLWLALNKKS